MKRYLVAALMGMILSTSCTRVDRPVQSNQLPMYGNLPRTPEQIKEDSAYVGQRLKEAGSKEAALRKILDEAWEYEKRGYFELAMQRFNEAWSMDANNAEVFHGFASLLLFQDRLDEAEKMYEQSLAINPKDAVVMCRLARLYQDMASRKLVRPWLAKVEEIKGLFAKSVGLYERASGLTTNKEELGQIYYQWAICLAIQKDFKGAWEKIHLARKYDGKFIQEGFIKKLSSDMPDPSPAQDNS